MGRKCTCILVAWLVAAGKLAFANYYYTTQFGTPVVIADRVIFSAPGFPNHRLICIDNNHGNKLWEINDTNRAIGLPMVLGNQLLVTVGADICGCDIKSGSLSVRYKTSYEEFYPEIHGKNNMLIFGNRTNMDYLTVIDTRTWRKKWEIPGLTGVVADGVDVVLCEENTRIPDAQGGYSVADQRLTAVSMPDGRILWRHPMVSFLKVAAVGDYFLMATDFLFDDSLLLSTNTPPAIGSLPSINDPPDLSLPYVLTCVGKSDGSTVKNTQFRLNPIDKMTAENRRLLVCGFDIEMRPDCLSFSVPELEAKKSTEKEWYSANYLDYVEVAAGRTNRFWKSEYLNSVANGYLYFAASESNNARTTMNRVELKSGRREKLYDEPVPAELRVRYKR